MSENTTQPRGLSVVHTCTIIIRLVSYSWALCSISTAQSGPIGQQQFSPTRPDQTTLAPGWQKCLPTHSLSMDSRSHHLRSRLQIFGNPRPDERVFSTVPGEKIPLHGRDVTHVEIPYRIPFSSRHFADNRKVTPSHFRRLSLPLFIYPLPPLHSVRRRLKASPIT